MPKSEKIIQKKYVLYWWYGGFHDCHIKQEEFNSLKELIEYHKEHRPNYSLYNSKDVGIGEDYYKVVLTYKPNVKRCVYGGKY